MKLGAENRTKVNLAIGLFAFAIVLAIYNSGLSRRLASPVPAAREQKEITRLGTRKDIRDLALQADLFRARQSIYLNSSRNIFSMKEEKQASQSDAGTQDAGKHDDGSFSSAGEKTLPIDLKFFGYFRKSGEPRTVCISQGDAVFLAQEGSLVGLRYRILEIKDNSVLLQDVLSNQQQSLALLQ
jgi:hypothetical protein